MPVTAKCTFFLTYKTSSVTFSLYRQPESLEALNIFDPKTGNPVDKLIQAWMKLLGTGVEMPYVRISNEAVNGDAVFFDRQYVTIGSVDPGEGGKIPDGTMKNIMVKTIIEDDPDFRNTAALVTFAANSKQKGRVFMRYIPDSIIDFPIGLKPTQEWDKGFIALVKLMKADQWRVRCLADEATNPPRKIKRIFRAAAGENLQVETTVNHVLAVDDIIRISGVAKTSGARGVWVVDEVVSATIVKLRDSAGTATTVANKGTLRKRTYDFPVITNGAWSRVTGRKAGRPFGAPAGRVKKR